LTASSGRYLYGDNHRLRDDNQIRFMLDKTRAATRTTPTPLLSGWHKAAAGVTGAALLDCVIFFAIPGPDPHLGGHPHYA